MHPHATGKAFCIIWYGLLRLLRALWPARAHSLVRPSELSDEFKACARGSGAGTLRRGVALPAQQHQAARRVGAVRTVHQVVPRRPSGPAGVAAPEPPPLPPPFVPYRCASALQQQAHVGVAHERSDAQRREPGLRGRAGPRRQARGQRLIPAGQRTIWCVSSLRRGHANLFCTCTSFQCRV